MEPCSEGMAGMFPEPMVKRAVTLRISGAFMASVDDYLRYAEQCVALAARSASPADKARLLQMAQAWRDLAGKHDNGKPKGSDTGG
jgi:hypothetical protein